MNRKYRLENLGWGMVGDSLKVSSQVHTLFPIL
jgi:hypothetical protein